MMESADNKFESEHLLHPHHIDHRRQTYISKFGCVRRITKMQNAAVVYPKTLYLKLVISQRQFILSNCKILVYEPSRYHGLDATRQVPEIAVHLNDVTVGR